MRPQHPPQPPQPAHPPPLPQAQAPAPLPPPRVLIIGAGVAGLSCAQTLLAAPLELSVVVLEARHRPGGRVLTHWLNGVEKPPDLADHPSPDQPLAPAPAPPPPVPPHPTSDQHAPITKHSFQHLAAGSINPTRTIGPCARISVDIGASIMHGCGDDNQLVFARAIEAGIRAPVVAGGGFYESTEHALWFNDLTGTRIPTSTIVEVHHIFFMASRYMAAVASQSDDGAANMQSVFDCGVQYVLEQLDGRQLTSVEKAVLKKICARSVGYCSPMSDMALMQASAGMEITSVDAHIGVKFEEDDPPFPGEVPSMSPRTIKLESSRLKKAILATQKPVRTVVASRKAGKGDRIVLDGYTPFLVDRLKEGVDIRTGQVVCGVSMHDTVPGSVQHELDISARMATRSQKRARVAESSSSEWIGDPSTPTRTVCVSTRSGEVHECEYAVITLPLGVLKDTHGEGTVTFSPPLSEEKMEAIEGMGMGVHNKIILRFREDHVFWPPKVPQLNCVDSRFQFFNLHSYGKTGVLLVHVFADSGFASGYWGMSDEAVVAEVLMVLGGMFCEPAADESDNSPSEPGPSSHARVAMARHRVAKLMNICEHCKRPAPPQANAASTCSGSREELICESCGLKIANVLPDLLAKTTVPAEQNNALKAKEKAVSKDEDSGIGKKSGDSEDEDELVEPLRSLPWDRLPAPEEYIVTRWDSDPFSKGSYSFMPCGSSWQMIDELAAPEPKDSTHPYLFFAGEHCSDLGWQCVHGAHETGIRAAKEIMACVTRGYVEVSGDLSVGVQKETEIYDTPVGNESILETESPLTGSTPQVNESTPASSTPPGNEGVLVSNTALTSTISFDVAITVTAADVKEYWTDRREAALSRFLVSFLGVDGNLTDVIDEIAYLTTSAKGRGSWEDQRVKVRQLVFLRIRERAEADDTFANDFLRFHSKVAVKARREAFPRPFEEINNRKRLVGLNVSLLEQRYSKDVERGLRKHAAAAYKNELSYAEVLNRIAIAIYKKDGGLMKKRCLREYLRKAVFGNGPQKEMYFKMYLENGE